MAQTSKRLIASALVEMDTAAKPHDEEEKDDDGDGYHDDLGSDVTPPERSSDVDGLPPEQQGGSVEVFGLFHEEFNLFLSLHDFIDVLNHVVRYFGHMRSDAFDGGVSGFAVFFHERSDDGLELAVDLQSDSGAAGGEEGGLKATAYFIEEFERHSQPHGSVCEAHVCESTGCDEVEDVVVVRVALALSGCGRYFFEQNASNGGEVTYAGGVLGEDDSLSRNYAVNDLGCEMRGRLRFDAVPQGDVGGGRRRGGRKHSQEEQTLQILIGVTKKKNFFFSCNMTRW